MGGVQAPLDSALRFWRSEMRATEDIATRSATCEQVSTAMLRCEGGWLVALNNAVPRNEVAEVSGQSKE